MEHAKVQLTHPILGTSHFKSVGGGAQETLSQTRIKTIRAVTGTTLLAKDDS